MGRADAPCPCRAPCLPGSTAIRNDRLEHRADPEAELADRLPRELHSQARRLRDAVELGPDSVVAVRTPQAPSAAFHNVCRHRGARILDGAGNCPGAITCPYHGWSYRHDGGAHRHAGARKLFPGSIRAQFGLRRSGRGRLRLRVRLRWRRSAAAGAESGASWPRSFAPHRFEDMVPLGPISEETWPVDWKIAMDNYLESYHVPIGHPGLYRMFTPDYDDQLVGARRVARGISWMREQRIAALVRAHVSAHDRRPVTHLPEEQRRCWRFYSALPNLGIDVYPGSHGFLPGAARWSRQVHRARRRIRTCRMSREMRALRLLELTASTRR
jgi:nitrite reductase/ring-hydroxylating ferredoxin subunit